MKRVLQFTTELAKNLWKNTDKRAVEVRIARCIRVGNHIILNPDENSTDQENNKSWTRDYMNVLGNNISNAAEIETFSILKALTIKCIQYIFL